MSQHIPEIDTENGVLMPLDIISGYHVRPGLYQINGATALEGGVNFTIHSRGATSCELLIYARRGRLPIAELRFPEHYRIGDVYSMIVYGLAIDEFEYAYRMDGPYQPEKGLLFDKNEVLLDPYARAVTGQHNWGEQLARVHEYRARVVRDNFDWGTSKQPKIPMRDLIIYELHVRGFTRHDSSGVEKPGTFAGLLEKLPYLKELGVNAVELMPVFEFDEMQFERIVDGRSLIDYWGYNPVCFFAPNTSYSSTLEHNHEGHELKNLIKTLNENGIEVILDVVFNHTAEGDETGPCISLKGIDNNVYYMLAPDGRYFNFSGCGNTLNCNHPIVQQMILECLRYWVINYRVDGFRFDLASILGRNEDGTPMNNPPLLQSLAFDPVLRNVKLIAEAWDAGGLYQVGSFPSWNRWAEWNGKYRDDLRSFLKGDGGMAMAAVQRITGSQDLYPVEKRGDSASVNFITCHDGFTMWDLYAYNEKHNWQNGWNDTDGHDDNRSWNCGIEGETNDHEINKTRNRMRKNAFAVLMMSRGTPMFLAGDEFGNTQFGNNNPYCQDNEISWLDWSGLDRNTELFEFCRTMIQLRKELAVVRGTTAQSVCGLPDVSWFGPYCEHDFSWDSHYVGIMYAGRDNYDTDDEIVYLAVNSWWQELQIQLPKLPVGRIWRKYVHTWEDEPIATEKPMLQSGEFVIGARSMAVMVAEKCNDTP